jgi:1-acyl-sn-glycerol-3-phosphate acyltransferase
LKFESHYPPLCGIVQLTNSAALSELEFHNKMSPIRIFQDISAFLITLLIWAYFLFGSTVIFIFGHIPAYLFSKNRAEAFQNLNHINMKGFFTLTRFLIPRTKFKIQKEIRQLHSSVIVCNHLSYLDPILLVSLLNRHSTIVKSTFFRVPFFGWLLRNSCYMPSTTSDFMGQSMVENLERIKGHLSTGGNFFVFPEGTRSRNGSLALFNKGAFTIARYCNAPLNLVYIKNTNKLFQPGTFLFKTHNYIDIEVELIGSIDPDYRGNNFSISAVADEARNIFEQKIARS